MDEVKIVAAQMCYCPSHNETMNIVAREGLYLSNNTGFTYESILSFFKGCELAGYPQYYVINSSDIAVGWYDIVPRTLTGRKVGYLGLGLRPEYRDRGIGTQLMRHAIQSAKAFGFTELRLECRASNSRALHIYADKFGFHKTGYKANGLILDGQPIPIVYMSKKLK